MPGETLTANRESLTGGMPARDLGPGEVEKMFGSAPTPRQRLEGQGIEFVESGAEMGGGRDVDPVEDYFKRVGLDKIQGFIAEQQGKNYPDTSSIKLPDGTSILFGEYKKIAIAIQNAQARGDRRAVEEIIREARRPAPPVTLARAPEPQPTLRPADWREGLPQDQQKRLKDFENRITGFNDQELQLVEAGIREARAKALKDGWQHKSVQEGDADMCLRVIQEKLVGQIGLELMLIGNGLYDHVKSVQQRIGSKDLQDTLLYLAGKLGYHDSLLENPPSDLFPPAARMTNGEWDTTGDKLAQFLRKLTTGNKLNNGG